VNPYGLENQIWTNSSSSAKTSAIFFLGICRFLKFFYKLRPKCRPKAKCEDQRLQMLIPWAEAVGWEYLISNLDLKVCQNI
jgi:hypothetical protein